MRTYPFFLGFPARVGTTWDAEHSMDDEYTAPVDVYRNILEDAVLAEKLGYYGFWLAEHHFTGNYSVLPNPLTLLAAIAARTDRIKLGAAVTCIPEHHPVRIAEEIAMLDLISEGRVDTALGRGVFPIEYAGFGLTVSESKPRFVEGLDLILRLLTETDVDYDGTYWKFLEPITLVPQPVQTPRPHLWLACNSKETIGVALDRGLDVVTNAGVFGMDRIREFRAAFVEQCEQRGLDPAEQRFGVQVWASYAPTTDAVEKAAQAARIVMRAAGRRISGEADIRAGTMDLSPLTGKVQSGDLVYSEEGGEASTDAIVDTNLIGDEEYIRAQAGILKEEMGVTDLALIVDTGEITPDERHETMHVMASILEVTAAEEAPAIATG